MFKPISYATMPSFSFILFTVPKKKNFEYSFSQKFALYVAPSTINLSNLDKSRMKHGGLLNKHCCKKSNIPKGLAEIVNFHFSHYKSMETICCHSNKSSYLIEIKTYIL